MHRPQSAIARPRFALVGLFASAALITAGILPLSLPARATDSAAPPGDPPMRTAQASQVRDRIAKGLERYDCARLNVTVDPYNRLWVTGFVRSPQQKADLERNMSQLAGGASYTIGIRILGAPLCQAMQVLREAEFRNAALGDRLVVGLLQGKVMLRESDPFVIDVTAPARKMHLYIDYYTLDGHVAHLLPGPTYPDNQVAASSRTVLGDAKEGPWWVGSPFGKEMLAGIASPTPLFKGPRPEYETAEGYLADLKKVLANRDDVLAVTLPIATRAR